MSKLKVNSNENIFTNSFVKLQGLASIVFFIFIYSIFITGSTYAFMNLSASSSAASGQGGCFEVSYTGQNLNAGNLLSTDNYLEGAHTTVTLSKASTCKIYTEANIYLHTNDTATAPIESVKALRYKLMTGETTVSEGIVSNKGDYLLATVTLTNTATTYTLYLWIDFTLSNGSYDETTYTGYIYADSNQTSTIENSYLVNFNSSGGSTVTPKNVIYGQTYGSLQTPTKDGYTFQGWSLVPANNQNTGSTQYITSTTQVSQEHNHTLYAVWAPKSYTVSFNANGGSVSPTSKQVTYGEIYGDLPSPSKSGSSFMGWNGKNLLNYNKILTNASNVNIVTDNNGYIKDTSPTSDSRGWGYAGSNWQTTLSAGTYTVTLNFSTPVTESTNNGVAVYSSSNSTITPLHKINNKNNDTFNFTLSSQQSIGIMIKGYDGVYRIQLETGNKSTSWEPFYVSRGTIVTQPTNHTLKAIWE